MDKYSKGLLLTLTLAFLSLSFSIFLFFLPDTPKEGVVLGVEHVKSPDIKNTQEINWNEKKLQYNENLFKIEYDKKDLLILPQSWKFFQYATIGTIENGKSIEENININNIYPNLESVSSLNYDGYQVDLFTYEQPYFFNKEENRKLYLTVYSTRKENDNYYIEVRDFNYLKNKEINQGFIEILYSIMDKDTVSSVLGVNNKLVDIAQVLGQAGTVKIFAKNCYDLSFTNDLPASFSGKTYKICSAGIGSGFLVNSNGEILTNAHVVNPNKFDTVINGVSTDGQYEIDMGTDLVSLLYAYLGDFASFLSEEQIQTFYIYFFSEMYKENYVKITGGTNEIYVQLDDNFDIDADKLVLSNKSSHQSASLIKSNDISSLYQILLSSVNEEDLFDDDIEDIMQSLSVQEGLTDVADLALIKMDSVRQIPSLIISTDSASTGEDIYVVGYPGVNEDNMLISTDGQASSTVTQGTITGIKPNTNNSYNLLQLDASIESGNSGGPILDNLGEVLGMTTYSYASTSGSFNWGISSDAINQFLIQSGSSNKANNSNLILSEALSDFSKDYFSRSKEALSSLVSSESTLGIVLNPLITLCDTNIAQGNDKSPWIDFDFIDIPNWGLLLIGGIFIVIVIVLVIIIIASKKSKNNGFPKTDYDDLPKTGQTQTPQSQPIPNYQAQESNPEIKNNEEEHFLRPQNQSLKSIRTGNANF